MRSALQAQAPHTHRSDLPVTMLWWASVGALRALCATGTSTSHSPERPACNDALVGQCRSSPELSVRDALVGQCWSSLCSALQAQAPHTHRSDLPVTMLWWASVGALRALCATGTSTSHSPERPACNDALVGQCRSSPCALRYRHKHLTLTGATCL